ncbi:MAG: hypothetical protein FIA82_11270 [Melioribacter sp.]|nr:hypothetical protein [Melioribacter sp.]
MKIEMIKKYILIIILFFAGISYSQTDQELNVIRINIEENRVGINEVYLRDLLNEKLENSRNIIQLDFNYEFLIPIRIMIYKDKMLIYESMLLNKENFNYEINNIIWIYNNYKG